jgi:hypothetical protein
MGIDGFVSQLCMTTGVNVILKMPRAYIQVLRWRAIWLTEILGFQIDEVSILLQLWTKTISRYVRKFRMLGHVDTAASVMHLHEELVIMDVLLQHPEKTRSEILHKVLRLWKNRLGSKCKVNATSQWTSPNVIELLVWYEIECIGMQAQGGLDHMGIN